MAEDKKTQMGTANPVRATGAQAVVPATTPIPATSPPYVPVPATTPPTAGAAGAAGAVTSYLPPVEDPLIGALLAGRYLVSRKLGEGGMGAVYLATHNLLEKQVALKVLHGEFARKADLVERFMQEAKAASRIRHENVIDISDFGQTPDGLVFFAMELLKGHDLHEEIARARLAGELLPWPRSKRIFLQICAALTAAHGHGIVHRDLKPENIYLVDFLGEPDFVKLLDFGIAKLTEVAEGDRKLTRTGMLFGTPEYMSPEQARGESVDLRVDVYAMGCILFQLVTGRVPFQAENFMGVLSLHLTEAPPSIPEAVFARIGAPQELAAIIERALSKDRNERWQTIAELANAIRIASGDAIPNPGVSVAMASVPAPASTTTRQTSQIAPLTATANRTTPVKTQWTGNLQVPEEDAPRAAGKSKLPLILGGLLVAGGAVAAIVMLSGRDGNNATIADTGSDAPKRAIDAGIALAPTPDAPPVPAVTLPEKVEIHLDSQPQKADVFDVVNNRVWGKTPLGFTVPGSTATRTFILRKAGYSDMVIELIPNRPKIDYSEKLVKGAAGTTVTKRVPDPNTATVKQDGSAAKPPETGSATKPPETGSAAKPPETGSAAKPPDPKPDPKPDCPPDEFPCLKEMPKDTPQQ
ncbi:MAG: protein kinase [Deltaproteobacteria bacterium]|nr:protein kinase [Deltaproteobacteria bacterium]